jgi:hypothetical protein
MHTLATALALHAACFGVGEFFTNLYRRDPYIDMPSVQAYCKTDSTVFYAAMLPKENTLCEPVLGRLVATDYCDTGISWYEPLSPGDIENSVSIVLQRMFANYYWYGRLRIPHFITQEGARAMYGLDQSAEFRTEHTSADGWVGSIHR